MAETAATTEPQRYPQGYGMSHCTPTGSTGIASVEIQSVRATGCMVHSFIISCFLFVLFLHSAVQAVQGILY